MIVAQVLGRRCCLLSFETAKSASGISVASYFESLAMSNDSSSDVAEKPQSLVLETAKSHQASQWSATLKFCRCLMIAAYMPRRYAVRSVCFMAKSTIASQWFPTFIPCRRLMIVAQMLQRDYYLSFLKWPSPH